MISSNLSGKLPIIKLNDLQDSISTKKMPYEQDMITRKDLYMKENLTDRQNSYR